MICRLRAVFCLLLLPSAFCLLPSPLRADIQQPPRAHAKGERLLQRRVEAPATATPQSLDVAAGSPAQITLHAEGESGRTIDFLIRAQPLHGLISGEPTRVSRNSVAVLYVPTPGDDSTSDEFTFSAQVEGTAVSAPETVRLRLIPPPPALATMPAELDFGAVKAGESSQAEFTLENRGGSEAVGRVEPPSPFVVDGPAEYHLAKGAQQTFRLIFQPQDGQVFSTAMHFRYETGGGVHLVGTGLVVPGLAAASRVGTPGVSAKLPPVGVGGDGDAFVASGAPVAALPVGSPTPALAVNGSGAQVAVATPAPTGEGPVTPRNERAFVGMSTDDTSIPVNEAKVREVKVTGVGRSTVDLSWKAPVPRPAKYRVEVRYLLVEDDRARVDWRPYAQSEVKVGRDDVTAHLRGLPSGGLQMLRIVAVDGAGRLAAPSPMTVVMMDQPATWWKPSWLKVLILLLLVCGALALRKRWEDQQILTDIDESRRRSNAESGLAWKV